jgi:hypothetical protein
MFAIRQPLSLLLVGKSEHPGGAISRSPSGWMPIPKVVTPRRWLVDDSLKAR